VLVAVQNRKQPAKRDDHMRMRMTMRKDARPREVFDE
jgi:hypothetical protein